MAADAEKPPIPFVVLKVLEGEVVVPPFALGFAGGNSVRVQNMLDKPLTVTHHGKLDAPDPFTLPARGPGAPPQKTYPIAAQADVPGSTFNITFEASVVNAFGRVGDPTIIIL